MAYTYLQGIKEDALLLCNSEADSLTSFFIESAELFIRNAIVGVQIGFIEASSGIVEFEFFSCARKLCSIKVIIPLGHLGYDEWGSGSCGRSSRRQSRDERSRKSIVGNAEGGNNGENR